MLQINLFNLPTSAITDTYKARLSCRNRPEIVSQAVLPAAPGSCHRTETITIRSIKWADCGKTTAPEIDGTFQALLALPQGQKLLSRTQQNDQPPLKKRRSADPGKSVFHGSSRSISPGFSAASCSTSWRQSYGCGPLVLTLSIMLWSMARALAPQAVFESKQMTFTRAGMNLNSRFISCSTIGSSPLINPRKSTGTRGR